MLKLVRIGTIVGLALSVQACRSESPLQEPIAVAPKDAEPPVEGQAEAVESKTAHAVESAELVKETCDSLAEMPVDDQVWDQAFGDGKVHDPNERPNPAAPIGQEARAQPGATTPCAPVEGSGEFARGL